jgi:hypothetical protein
MEKQDQKAFHRATAGFCCRHGEAPPGCTSGGGW